MKKIAKGFGFGIIVAVIGLLIFGAVNRTIAMNEEETLPGSESAEYAAPAAGNEIAVSSNETDAISEHDTLSTPIALLPLGELNQAEIDALLYMREEEKLARDVYLFLASQWGLPAFSNIASSEQTHMDLLLELINRYDLNDSASAETGVFNNAELQALYNQLIAQGSISAEEAFKVGAAIEEIDILDLQVRLSETDQQDIQQVFDTLIQGSYNHLNAFAGNLSNRFDIVYTPQYISNDLFQQILSTETGGSVSGFGNSSRSGQGGGGNGTN
ncbi:MAG: hypothetical protein CVU42_01000 [Chloroflexi bacterium HGW-Chloroflexi-4]|jgi:hypothetical protein|nr:MAG: hypothetical protein CVU42_01000 [Chloroflexi bacterium HGW-Chloroflexi-4]